MEPRRLSWTSISAWRARARSPSVSRFVSSLRTPYTPRGAPFWASFETSVRSMTMPAAIAIGLPERVPAW